MGRNDFEFGRNERNSGTGGGEKVRIEGRGREEEHFPLRLKMLSTEAPMFSLFSVLWQLNGWLVVVALVQLGKSVIYSRFTAIKS